MPPATVFFCSRLGCMNLLYFRRNFLWDRIRHFLHSTDRYFDELHNMLCVCCTEVQTCLWYLHVDLSITTTVQSLRSFMKGRPSAIMLGIKRRICACWACSAEQGHHKKGPCSSATFSALWGPLSGVDIEKFTWCSLTVSGLEGGSVRHIVKS